MNSELAILSGRKVIVNSISSGKDFKYKNVNQWRLISEDNFHKDSKPHKWNFKKLTECKSLNFLGGHCKLGKREITFELEHVVSHKEVKVEANFHFIGNWNTNSAFLRVDDKKKPNKLIWTDFCKNRERKNRLNNMCEYEVCKLNSLINVTFHHKKSYLKLIFGNDFSHNKPCETSYAISNFRIYIR
jgi:hypothetical protein